MRCSHGERSQRHLWPVHVLHQHSCAAASFIKADEDPPQAETASVPVSSLPPPARVSAWAAPACTGVCGTSAHWVVVVEEDGEL